MIVYNYYQMVDHNLQSALKDNENLIMCVHIYTILTIITNTYPCEVYDLNHEYGYLKQSFILSH